MAQRTPQAGLYRLAREVARADGRFALACSGGVDSTALLLSAAFAVERKWLPAFVVVHVDHLTRPETADEARSVARLCDARNIPITRVIVETLSESVGESPEAHLRELRYAALSKVVVRLGLVGVMTAHTQDDQVETILMRLFTGAGPVGAAGMPGDSRLDEFSLRIFRPFLGIQKSELAAVVRDAGIEPMDDPTNRDLAFRRNALRNLVLPSIAEHFPGFEQALIRSVGLAERDGRFLDEAADTEFSRVVEVDPGSISIDRAWMRAAELALVTRVVRTVLRQILAGDAREVTFERVDALTRAASGRTGAVIQFPGGITAKVERLSIRFTRDLQA